MHSGDAFPRATRTFAWVLALVALAGNATQASAASSERAEVTLASEHFTSRDGRCRFDVSHVTLAGIPAAAARRIERTLEGGLTGDGYTDPTPLHVASHDERIASCEQSLSTDSVRSTLDDRRELTVDFDRDGIFSATVSGETYFTPSVHPSSTSNAYIFDLSDGHRYRLAEMFVPKSRSALRNLVRAALADADRRRGANRAPYAIAPLYPSLGLPIRTRDVRLTNAGIVVCNLFEGHAAESTCAEISALDLRSSGIIARRGPLRIFLDSTRLRAVAVAVTKRA